MTKSWGPENAEGHQTRMPVFASLQLVEVGNLSEPETGG
jgi:hypothetical protein